MTDPALDREYLTVSKAGDVHVGWPGSHEAFDDVRRRLFGALVDEGYTPQGSCVLDQGVSCVLHRDDRLATITADTPYAGADYIWIELHVRPVGHRPRSRWPGPCVVPPSRARPTIVDSSGIDPSGHARRSVETDPVQTRVGVDLDGDGVGEVFVPRPNKGRCPWEIPHDVYVMRGSCGHRVGTIVGEIDRDTALAPFVHGLRTVTTTASWSRFERGRSAPVSHRRTRRYVFDGKTLRKRRDRDETMKCHHCGIERCEPS